MSEIISENDIHVPATSSTTNEEKLEEQHVAKPKITVPLANDDNAEDTIKLIPRKVVAKNTTELIPDTNNVENTTEPIPKDSNAEDTIKLVPKTTLVENTNEPIVPVERKDPVTPTHLPLIVADASLEQKSKSKTTDPLPELVTPASPPIRSRESLRQRMAQHKVISLLLIALLLTGILVPVVEGVIYGVQAYSTYTTIRSHASSGVQHLLNVKSLFSSSKTGGSTATTTSKLLDTNTLMQAKKELTAAHSDFAQVQTLIDHASFIPLVEQYAPQYRPQIISARAASRVGEDVASMGQILINTAMTLAPKLRGPLLNASNTPLVTSADLELVGTTIDGVLPYINDIQQQSQSMSLSALPVSTHQRQQVQQLLQLLPQAKTALTQGRTLLDAAGWLLGVDGPRTFLVQTMDRGELRPTGGFTGQYGELHITGGRVGPFSLRDISLIEYADNSPTTDHQAPAAYRSWWPFANWGLRDSNLSADFPTSAQIAMGQYKLETHRQVDGVILFTPFLIEHVLQVTGPIRIPAYNETITSQNLEARLHYYQLDNAGIAKQISISGSNKATSDRKQFTSLVARTLMDNIRHSSPTTLLAIAKQMLHDFQTKDLQVYLSNTQLEDLLSHYGYAAQVDRSTTHDGLYVVQTNVSASKASQYVKTTIHDTVTLDANGGATHALQMQLAYTQLNFVYGLDTYRDYVRVYVPPSAKFLGGDGFDTGTPLCGGPLAVCGPRSIYAHDEMVCPAGLYFAGASAPMIGDNYAGTWHPLDKIGPPTNMTSDEAGRAMFGGYVVIPKNCTMTVTLSWYVPLIGHGMYDILVQRQAGTFPELELTVLPTPGNCAKSQEQGLYVDRVLGQDTSFTLTKTNNLPVGGTCYPQPDV